MVECLSKAQLAHWKQAFEVLDKDEDGRISADDVAKLLTSNGEGSYTAADAKVAIARADTVGDGSVDFVEFLTFVAAHAKPGMLRSGQLTPEDDEKSMRAAFDKFSGGAASVSLEAFATVAKKLKEPWADGADADVHIKSTFALLSGGKAELTFDQFKVALSAPS